MIKLELPRPEPDDQLWHLWRARCEAERDALIQYWEHGKGKTKKVKQSLYRHKPIFERYYHGGSDSPAFAPFYRKCAYCEVSKSLFHMDHYRPKHSVSDALTRDSADGTKKVHPGYYWLAYEINNLLLACDDCNVFFKKEQFPLMDESARAWVSSAELGNETPMLLNPLVDNPEEHIGIDLATGILTFKTDRGEQTIKLLNLNRDALIESRREKIRAITLSWLQLGASDTTKAERQEAFDHLVENQLDRVPFTMTARARLAQLAG